MKEERKQPHKNFCGKRKDFIKLYQKTGSTDFDQLQDIDSSNNEGTNSLVNGERMVCRAYLHNERHKTRNGWYLGMVTLISSILGLLILRI